MVRWSCWAPPACVGTTSTRSAPRRSRGCADTAGVAAVSIRNVRTTACPIDGWLALSAGRRAADAPRGSAEPLCRTAGEPVRQGKTAVLESFSTYSELAAEGTFGAVPGTLGDLLREERVSVSAIGPGAAIATVGTDSKVVGDYESRPRDPAALARAARAAAAARRPARGRRRQRPRPGGPRREGPGPAGGQPGRPGRPDRGPDGGRARRAAAGRDRPDVLARRLRSHPAPAARRGHRSGARRRPVRRDAAGQRLHPPGRPGAGDRPDADRARRCSASTARTACPGRSSPRRPATPPPPGARSGWPTCRRRRSPSSRWWCGSSTAW